MAPFDAAFGAGQNTVNTLLPQLYKALSSAGLFTFDIDINAAGFKSVHVDISQSPTVDFTPLGISDHVLKTVTKGVQNAPGYVDLDASEKNAVVTSALAVVSNINFDIIAQGIQLQLTYTDSSKKPLALTAKLVLTTLASIDASASPSITFQAESGTISTNKPDLDDILNSAIVPFVRSQINNDILKPLAIPVLGFDGIQIAVPVVQIVNNYLLAYTSLGLAPPDFPTEAVSWPSDGVFIAADTSLIAALANNAISSAASNLPHVGFTEGPFTGDLGISLSQLENVDVADDGSISGSITARAAANITVHTPWPLPNFSFGPVASGTVGVSAKPKVIDNVVQISNLGITQFDLSLDWGVIPSWISVFLKPLLGPLENFLFEQLIEPRIKEILSPLVIPVYTIPSIGIPVENGKVTLSLTNIDTTKLAVGGRTQLVAFGTPTIS